MAKRRAKTKHEGPSGPALYPYQRRWVEDDSRFKIACKARQIGFTFAAAWRVVDRRLEQPGTTLWLSASERQALEAMEHVRRFAKELGVVAIYEEDFIEGTLLKQHAVRFPNGSRIVALPANPDTVRGFAGDVVLDEFAFHRDAEAIWRAAFATATRGFQLEIISTPNGARGRYYDLARAAGLVDYDPPEKSRFLPRAFPPWWHRPPACGDSAHRRDAGATEDGMGGVGMTDCGGARGASGHGFSEHSGDPELVEGSRAERNVAQSASSEGAWGNPLRVSPAPESRVTSHQSPFLWSPHWVDLLSARTQGFVVDVESLRAAIADEDAWQQEYCCRFLADAAHYLPPELVVAAEHPAATTTFFLSPAAGAAGLGEARRVSPSGLTTEMPGEAPPWKGAGENLFGFPQRARGSFYLGVDIGRRRDLTVLWLLEADDSPAPVYWTRGLVTLDRQPFAAQRQALDSLLALRASDENRNSKIENRTNGPSFEFRFSSFGSFLIRRCALDATGLGAMLAEELRAQWGARVEPVVFTQAVKENLAVRVKRLLEDGRLRLPADPAVRAALGSVKRYITPSGNIRFDADRTEAAGHADHFWALALALGAAEEPDISLEFVSSTRLRSFAQAAIF